MGGRIIPCQRRTARLRLDLGSLEVAVRVEGGRCRDALTRCKMGNRVREGGGKEDGRQSSGFVDGGGRADRLTYGRLD